jgi:hypothetical protein
MTNYLDLMPDEILGEIKLHAYAPASILHYLSADELTLYQCKYIEMINKMTTKELLVIIKERKLKKSHNGNTNKLIKRINIISNYLNWNREDPRLRPLIRSFESCFV